MANKSDALSSLIIEGFICPECQQDMTSVELLQAHFELMHLNKTNPTNSPSSKNNGTYNEIIESSNTSNSSTSVSSSASSSQISLKFMKQYFNQNQQEGYFRSHTNEFKKQRDNTIGRYVVQTNKLLITLDKLVSILDFLNDDTKRESHYKSIVSWVDDKDVNLCPNCAKSFSILNRKHHCRLCGAIMCNKCSQFISFALAKQLTDPDSFVKANLKKSNSNDSSFQQTEFRLKRADSITSLNSYFFKSGSKEKETSVNLKNKKEANLEGIYLRLCFDCGNLLEKKYKLLKEKIIRPELANLYDELHSCIIESQRLYPVYTKMAESLNSGETVHQLSYAEDMRHKLIKLFQQIESISGNILKNENDGTETSQISNDQLKLQRNIRFFAINFLKEHSFNLSALPTPDEYAKLTSQRKLYLIEEMKRAELEQLKQKREIDKKLNKNKPSYNYNSKTSTTNDINNNKGATKISIDNANGWIPQIDKQALLLDDDDDDDDLNKDNDGNNDHDLETDDGTRSITSKKSSSQMSDQDKALRIQIQLVEGYLKDAQKQNKLDEVNLLQKNLNELLNMLVNK